MPVFDDRIRYWRAGTPAAGVKNPNTETQIQVKSVSKDGAVMEVVGQTGHGDKKSNGGASWNWWDYATVDFARARARGSCGASYRQSTLSLAPSLPPK